MKNERLEKNQTPNTKGGITLVALVITIVVLLILAGAVISISLNGGDLFEKSQNAVAQHNKRVEEEENKINEVWSIIGNIQGIDWNAAKAKATSSHPEQTQSGDIGIGTDGELVNLDNWLYSKINNTIQLKKSSSDLGSEYGSGSEDETSSNGYIGSIVAGKIVGKVPQYIKLEGTAEWLPVTDISFEGITNLVTAPELPKTIATISDNAFNNCSGLETVTIPNSVTSIGSRAFQYCSSLANITIPDSVASIGESAFFYCSSLANITIPDSVTSIGTMAFSDCGLTSVTIPNSVTRIESFAFSNCSSLANITIPNSVTRIESNAFSNCSSLANIYIPSSVTTIDASDYYGSPFAGCSSLLKVYCGASEKPSGWGLYWNYYIRAGKLTSYWNYTREAYLAEIAE